MRGGGWGGRGGQLSLRQYTRSIVWRRGIADLSGGSKDTHSPRQRCDQATGAKNRRILLQQHMLLHPRFHLLLLPHLAPPPPGCLQPSGRKTKGSKKNKACF